MSCATLFDAVTAAGQKEVENAMDDPEEITATFEDTVEDLNNQNQ